VALLICAMLVPPRATAQDAFERISSTDAGYSAEALDDLRGFLRTVGSESLLLLHDGLALYGQLNLQQGRWKACTCSGSTPRHGLVLVHRVDTERAFAFKDFDLVQIIRRVHRARLPGRP
jgi:hypothetical protein